MSLQAPYHPGTMRFFRRQDGRVYTVFPASQDLFGTWVIVTVRGSVWTRQGGLKTYPAPDLATAAKLEVSIARKRLAHGYVEQ